MCDHAATRYEIQSEACAAKYAQLAAIAGENVKGLSPLEAGEKLISAVERVLGETGLPRRLRDVGVNPSSFKEMAAVGIKSGNVPVNPKYTTEEDLYRLLELAY